MNDSDIEQLLRFRELVISYYNNKELHTRTGDILASIEAIKQGRMVRQVAINKRRLDSRLELITEVTQKEFFGE